MKSQPNPAAAEEQKCPPPPAWLKLPAVLAILFCVALGFSIGHQDPSALSLHYRDIAQKALDQKDYPTALVAALRLLSFGESFRNESLFKLALAHQGLGQTSDASNLFEMIAPLDKPVYAPAHLFVARSLIARASRSRQTEDLIVAQLRNVLILDPDSVEAKELLSRLKK
ncbi:MAG: hypothetical protein WCO94_06570 [Verrucomicrobiota bacterium]